MELFVAGLKAWDVEIRQKLTDVNENCGLANALTLNPLTDRSSFRKLD
jgi:hypothetical protein